MKKIILTMIAVIGLGIATNAQNNFRGEPSLCYNTEKITFYSDFSFKMWDDGVMVLNGTYMYDKGKGVINLILSNGNELQMTRVYVDQNGFIQQAKFRDYWYNKCR